MDSLQTELMELRDKYLPLIVAWLNKNLHKHSQRFNLLINCRDTLINQKPFKSASHHDKFKEMLRTAFPEEKYFPETIDLTSDIESDDDHSRTNDSTGSGSLKISHICTLPAIPTPTQKPIHNPFAIESSAKKYKPPPPKPMMQASIEMAQCSIAAYKTKTTKMSSAAQYAKPSKPKIVEEVKKTISVPYKEEIKPKKQPYDPKADAIKLNLVKEKLYLKTYMKIEESQKIDAAKNNPDIGTTANDEKKSETEAPKSLQVAPCKRLRQRIDEKDAKLAVEEPLKKSKRRMTVDEETYNLMKTINAPRVLRQRSNSVYYGQNNMSDTDVDEEVCGGRIPIKETLNPTRKKGKRRQSNRLKEPSLSQDNVENRMKKLFE